MKVFWVTFMFGERLLGEWLLGGHDGAFPDLAWPVNYPLLLKPFHVIITMSDFQRSSSPLHHLQNFSNKQVCYPRPSCVNLSVYHLISWHLKGVCANHWNHYHNLRFKIPDIDKYPRYCYSTVTNATFLSGELLLHPEVHLNIQKPTPLPEGVTLPALSGVVEVNF